MEFPTDLDPDSLINELKSIIDEDNKRLYEKYASEYKNFDVKNLDVKNLDVKNFDVKNLDVKNLVNGIMQVLRDHFYTEQDKVNDKVVHRDSN